MGTNSRKGVYRKSNKTIYHLQDGKAKTIPDLVLVDVCGFVDVFEIKKHTPPSLLNLDTSHEPGDYG